MIEDGVGFTRGNAVVFRECLCSWAAIEMTKINPMVALSWMITAFSPRKQAITLYLSSEFKERDTLLKAVGKHSCGEGCVYIKRLSDVHLPTLKKLVKASVRHTKKNG